MLLVVCNNADHRNVFSFRFVAFAQLPADYKPGSLQTLRGVSSG